MTLGTIKIAKNVEAVENVEIMRAYEYTTRLHNI